MDLNHCLAFSPSKIDIKVGTYEDCKDAKLLLLPLVLIKILVKQEWT